MSNQSSKRTLSPSNWKFFPELVLQVKLILRLMNDPRISPLLKALPVGALIYWVVPFDVMPGLPFDDAAVLWGASSLFIELCPPAIVQQHRDALRMAAQNPGQPSGQPDVVDAEFRDLGANSAEDPHARR